MSTLNEILNALKAGEIDAKIAESKIRSLTIADLGHTRVDLDRRARTGVSEVIYGAGKTSTQILEIAKKIIESDERVLITRVSDDAAVLLKKNFANASFNEISKTFTIGKSKEKTKTHIAIISAGTSDMYVAEEARVCAEFLGSDVRMFNDCGVAGLHRLVSVIDEIRKAKVIIGIAGMEGALASVVAGLVKAPVIAVPTSVGYGANFGGLAALLAMMNSCANGVSVVNIDNGFGAAYNAHIINSI